MLSNIRIILLNTFHPGNIGSAARAMKTMGLTDLCLVTPQRFPDPDAESMAAGAQDVLAGARVFQTLDKAIADCSMVVGTSARTRNPTFTRPMLTAEDCSDKLVAEAARTPVALVFGQETMGLTNQELEKCHYHVSIDAHPEYPVLNVAAAIQILCYDIRKAALRKHQQDFSGNKAKDYPLTRELEYFYQHLEDTLNDINFIIKQHPGLAMTRLRRLFNRARPEAKELNMLRGILAAIQKREVKRNLRLTETVNAPGHSRMTTIDNTPHTIWTTQTLHQALVNDPLFSSGNASLQLVDGIEPCLEITMHEFGDLPIYITVSGEQIIADAVLWPLAQVTDVHALNDDILRTHKLFPLSTISLDRFPGGEDYYTLFGALSSASLLQNIILEIETLAANAIKATEAYNQHLVAPGA